MKTLLAILLSCSVINAQEEPKRQKALIFITMYGMLQSLDERGKWISPPSDWITNSRSSIADHPPEQCSPFYLVTVTKPARARMPAWFNGKYVGKRMTTRFITVYSSPPVEICPNAREQNEQRFNQAVVELARDIFRLKGMK